MVAGACSVSPTSLTIPEGWGDLGDWLIDDLEGGVLQQADDTVIWHRGAGAQVPAELVVALDGEQVWLQDVSVLDGITQAWFTRSRGSTIEDVLQTLERVPIGGPTPVVVNEVGAWESASTATVGGEVVAYQTWAEGFYTFGIGAVDGSDLEQPWNPYREISEPYLGCEGCPTDLIVSDDGARVAYLHPETEAFTPLLVILDPVTGNDVIRERFHGMSCCQGGDSERRISDVDLFGDVVLLNVSEGDFPSFAMWKDISDPEAEWQEFRVRGSARLLRSELQVGLPGS